MFSYTLHDSDLRKHPVQIVRYTTLFRSCCGSRSNGDVQFNPAHALLLESSQATSAYSGLPLHRETQKSIDDCANCANQCFIYLAPSLQLHVAVGNVLIYTPRLGPTQASSSNRSLHDALPILLRQPKKR